MAQQLSTLDPKTLIAIPNFEAMGNQFVPDLTGSKVAGKIHLRLQQRSKKQSLTTIEGLDDDLDLERICKYMRKTFNCNGTVLEGTVISLQGDQRENVVEWLVSQEILTKAEAKSRIVIHG